LNRSTFKSSKLSKMK